MKEPYNKLPRPPQPLNNPQLIQRQGPEQHLCRISITSLPRQDAPKLPVVDYMRANGQPEQVFAVRHAGEQRAGHDGNDEIFGRWGVCEARG